MFTGEKCTPFQNLPPEMMVEVFEFVDLEGKKESRLVCKRWRWILDHPDSGLLCLKHRGGKKSKDSIKCILKSQAYIDTLGIHDFKMTWPMMIYSRNKFPPIRKVELCSGNSERTMISILKYGCIKTESIFLGGHCFSHVRSDILSRMLSGIKWNQLTELNLKVTSAGGEFMTAKVNWHKTHTKSYKNHVEGIEQIFKKVTVPNLRILRLSYEENEISAGLIKLTSEFMTFIERQSKTLKVLRLRITLIPNVEGVVLNFENIPSPFFSAEQQENVAQNLKLDSFEIEASHFDTLVHLVPPCVWESDKLTKLTWRPTWQLPSTPQPMQSLIQRSQNTLTDVAITFISSDIDLDPFQMSWLESCPSLRKLTIVNFDKFVNVQLLLPQVRKLDIGFINFDSVDNVSSWITEAFQNLEDLQLSVLSMDGQNLQLDWVQNLLMLRRLREIRFGLLCSCSDLFASIRNFCNDKPRLIFKAGGERKRQVQAYCRESCLIKVLPIQNIK